jgi:hypothetical protein
MRASWPATFATPHHNKRSPKIMIGTKYSSSSVMAEYIAARCTLEQDCRNEAWRNMT